MTTATIEAPAQKSTRSTTERYAKAIEASKRIRWDIDRDVIRGRAFDFDQKFLPDGLSLVDELAFLDALRAFLAPPAASTAAAAPSTAGNYALTVAEAAVLELMARGLDNHAIARQLGKSEKTVRNQVSTIFDKLGVHSRAEAIVQAIGRHPPRT